MKNISKKRITTQVTFKSTDVLGNVSRLTYTPADSRIVIISNGSKRAFDGYLKAWATNSNINTFKEAFKACPKTVTLNKFLTNEWKIETVK